MAEAILGLSRDSSNLDKMGKAGGMYAERLFDISRTVSEVDSIFEEVVK